MKRPVRRVAVRKVYQRSTDATKRLVINTQHATDATLRQWTSLTSSELQFVLISRNSIYLRVSFKFYYLKKMCIQAAISTHSRKNRLLVAIICNFTKTGGIKYSLMIA